MECGKAHDQSLTRAVACTVYDQHDHHHHLPGHPVHAGHQSAGTAGTAGLLIAAEFHC